MKIGFDELIHSPENHFCIPQSVCRSWINENQIGYIQIALLKYFHWMQNDSECNQSYKFPDKYIHFYSQFTTSLIDWFYRKKLIWTNLYATLFPPPFSLSSCIWLALYASRSVALGSHAVNFISCCFIPFKSRFALCFYFIPWFGERHCLSWLQRNHWNAIASIDMWKMHIFLWKYVIMLGKSKF